VGSNPTPSANLPFKYLYLLFISCVPASCAQSDVQISIAWIAIAVGVDHHCCRSSWSSRSRSGLKASASLGHRIGGHFVYSACSDSGRCGLGMLRRLTNGEFALALLASSLFWIAVIAGTTSYAPTDRQKDVCYQAAAKAGHGTDECKALWEKTTSDPVAAFTLVLAISTIGLWVATLGLYIGGERHSERELRAYIVATVQAEVRNFHTANPTVLLGFVNAGQTPAHGVRIWTSSGVAKFPLDNPPLAPAGRDPGDSLGVIGPHGSFHTENIPEHPVTADERQAVTEGSAAFFVYGEIFYRDAFGRQRHTRFCHLYQGEVAKRPNGPLAHYNKWNEAT
jgi:hypothetical protein